MNDRHHLTTTGDRAGLSEIMTESPNLKGNLPGRREIPEIRYDLNISEPLSSFFFLGNPLSVLHWVEENHGSLASFVSPAGTTYYVTSDPEIVDYVLKHSDKGRGDAFDKSELLVEGAGWIIGDNNILATSNDEWREQRRIIGPYFSRGNYSGAEVLQTLRECISQTRDELKDRIRGSQTGYVDIDSQDEMTLLALRTAMNLVFGLPDLSRERLLKIQHHARVVHSVFPIETLIPGDIPFDKFTWVSPRAREIVESRDYILQLGKDLIEECSRSDKDNFVKALLEKGCPDSIEQNMVLHQVIAILFAAHETTGNNLGWVFSHLAQEPALAAQLGAEYSTLSFDSLSGLKDLETNLPLIGQTINEGLRMYPPVYLLMRLATDDVAIETERGIVNIPKGTEVFLNVFGAQREEEHWGSDKMGYPANRFNIDRWSKENIAERDLSRDDLNLFSFGGGPRVCMGSHLFRTEAFIALGEYQSLFNFAPLFDDLEGDMKSDFTLQREGGFPIRVSLKDPD